MSNAVDGAEDVFHQFLHIVGATVGKFLFGKSPNSFIGVELRCIRRKVLDAQASMLIEKLLDWRSFVRGRVIEQNDDRTAHMAQQLAQEYTYFFLSYIVIEEQIVESQTLPL